MSKDIRTGGCMCGEARYEVDLSGAKTSNCHCRDCQKNSGGAFMPFTSMRDGQLKWIKEPQGAASISPAATRRFCTTCGTPMTWEGVEYQQNQSFSTGTLDDVGGIAIAYEIYTRSRWPSIRPVDGALQFEGGYIAKEDNA